MSSLEVTGSSAFVVYNGQGKDPSDSTGNNIGNYVQIVYDIAHDIMYNKNINNIGYVIYIILFELISHTIRLRFRI